jgi:hypothetical protein
MGAMFKFDVRILSCVSRHIKMDNPAVLTFCRESLRSCYTILGREGFQAEVDYLLRCYAGVGVGVAAAAGVVPRCQRPGDESVSVFSAAAQPAASGGAGCQRQEENAVSRPDSDLKGDGGGGGAKEVAAVSKWARKPVPDKERCHRVTPYNGGQCSFRAVEGTTFCSRHTDK